MFNTRGSTEPPLSSTNASPALPLQLRGALQPLIVLMRDYCWAQCRE